MDNPPRDPSPVNEPPTQPDTGPMEDPQTPPNQI
jgi:hypothetical protein